MEVRKIPSPVIVNLSNRQVALWSTRAGPEAGPQASGQKTKHTDQEEGNDTDHTKHTDPKEETNSEHIKIIDGRDGRSAQTDSIGSEADNIEAEDSEADIRSTDDEATGFTDGDSPAKN